MLTKYDFPGDKIPFIRGSAIKALNGDKGELGAQAIEKLMDALDTYIPEPTREVDKPFLMPVEGVFSISGRGTVATGRIERGKVKVGDEVEIVGFGKRIKTTVTGVEMFRKNLMKVKLVITLVFFFVVLRKKKLNVVWLLQNQVALLRIRNLNVKYMS